MTFIDVILKMAESRSRCLSVVREVRFLDKWYKSKYYVSPDLLAILIIVGVATPDYYYVATFTQDLKCTQVFFTWKLVCMSIAMQWDECLDRYVNVFMCGCQRL